MTCSACGEQPKNTAKDFTKAVIEINNPETLVLFRKVVIPTSMGDETSVPAAIGKYHNVLLVYEANNHAYLYSSDGIPTLLTSDVAQELEEKINKVADDLQTETANRQGADNELSGRINTLDHNIGVVAGDLSAETINRTNADKTLQDNIDAEALARGNADSALDGRLTTVEGIAATAVQPADINRVVATDLALDPTVSTSTVQLNESKVNLATGTTSSDNVVLPVASSTQAGVMNSSTFDAITNNKNNIDALLSGSVAVTGLPASPSQSDITTAWQTETGLTTLINRASVYDVTNDKVWTYYSNDQTWHAASNTAQVTINTFTNSSEGTILGSTNTGQIFAENDGTGSVNGWDTLTGNVSTNTNNIGSLQTAVAGKQDILTAGSNITIASNVISATDTTYTAGNAITIDAGDNNRIDAAIYPADFFTANATSTSTASSSLSLTDTLNAKLEDVKLYGDTEQQTYTGKNLFDGILELGIINGNTGNDSPNPDYVRSKDYIMVDELTDYAISSTNPDIPAFMIYEYKADYSYNLTSNVVVQKDSYWQTKADTKYIRFRPSIQSSDITMQFQVEKGTAPTAYEPYVGGVASPNPDYPQDIHVVTGAQTVDIHGKNLFTGNFSQFNSTGGTGTTYAYFKLPDDGVYTLTLIAKNSVTGSSTTYLGFTATGGSTTDPRVWAFGSSSTGSAGSVFSITNVVNGVNLGYISLYNKFSANLKWFTDNFDIQLEKGDTRTAYEPYQGQSYTVRLGSLELAKIGDYQDYIYKSGDDWYVHKETREKILDGTETWNSQTGSHTVVLNLYTPTTGWGAYAGNKPLFCSIAKSNDAAGSSNDSIINICRFNNTGVNFLLDVAQSDFPTLTSFQTWIETHDVTLHYALATPTDTQITDTDLISDLNALAGGNTYDGETNIIITATGTNLPALLKAEYYRKTLEGIVETIPQAQVQADWTQVDADAKDYIKNKPVLATVATTGAYSDLIGTPTIPTVNDATLTIQKNGTTVQTFTANASSNVTANITVPVITLTDTDPGEGSALAENHFIAVYNP